MIAHKSLQNNKIHDFGATLASSPGPSITRHMEKLLAILFLAVLVSVQAQTRTITITVSLQGGPQNCTAAYVNFATNSRFQYQASLYSVTSNSSGCGASNIQVSDLFMDSNCIQNRKLNNRCSSSNPYITSPPTSSTCAAVFSEAGSSKLHWANQISGTFDSGTVCAPAGTTGYFFFENSCAAAAGGAAVVTAQLQVYVRVIGGSCNLFSTWAIVVLAVVLPLAAVLFCSGIYLMVRRRRATKFQGPPGVYMTQQQPYPQQPYPQQPYPQQPYPGQGPYPGQYPTYPPQQGGVVTGTAVPGYPVPRQP